MDGLAAMAPIQRLEAGLRPPVSHARVPMRDWTRMAAMLVLGAGIGYAASGFRATTDSGWHVAVANYQALYSRATLAPLENSEPALRAQVAAISEQLGLTIPYESLLVPGLTFKRAQTLSFQGKPLVQFAYTDADGAPVAFCVMRDETGATPVHLGIVAGLNAVSWSHGGYGFIVIGDLGQSALRQAAEQLSRAI